MATVTKGLIGEEDISHFDGSGTNTFTRENSTGGTLTLNKVGTEVDALVVYGGGVNYTNATITSALTAIGTSTKATLLIRPGTWTISTNVDWSAYTNVTFKFANGAVIKPSSGFTITLTGVKIDALPDQQIFDLSSSGYVILDRSAKAYIDWFGTNAAAFGYALSSVPAHGTLVFLNKAYTFSTGITINKDINIDTEGSGYINYTGTGTAVTINGEATYKKIKLSVKRNSVSWSTGEVGVLIGGASATDSVSHCQLEFPIIQGFETGLLIESDSSSAGKFLYNSVHIGDLYKNEIALKLYTTSTGVINSNTLYFSGSIGQGSDTELTTDRYGIVLQGDGSGGITGNNFHDPSIEIASATATSIAFDVKGTTSCYNNYVYGRYEEGSTYLIREDGKARNNYYVSYTSSSSATLLSSKISTESTASYPGTNKFISNRILLPAGLKDIFPGDIIGKALVSSKTSAIVYNVVFPGMVWLKTDGSYVISDSDAVLYDGYFVNAVPVGRIVDTSVVKDFWLASGESSVSDTTHYVVRCYDSGTTTLSGTSPYYVTAITTDYDTTYGATSSAYYGGAYTIPAQYSVTHIHFPASVKKAFIGYSATSAVGRKFSIMVDASIANPQSYAPVSINPLEGIPDFRLYSSASPVGGFISKGDVVWDTDAASGAAPGWYCVDSGTTTATDGEPAAETNLVVGAIGSSASGDIVGVILDNGQWMWTVINGAPSGSTIVLTNAVPAGRSIPAGAKVRWFRMRAMANLS